MLNGFRGVRRLVFGLQLTVLCWQTVGSAGVQAQTPAAGASGTILGEQIAALVGAPGVSRAHWGVMVEGMDGVPLYELNSGQLFQPASNAKLFTTAAAMALLGPEKRFETRVVARGTISKKGELDGELLLVGGGDANLSGRTVPYVPPPPAGAPGQAVPTPGQDDEAAEPKVDPLRYLEAMADEVVRRGIKVVHGDVVGDDTLFPWEPYGSDWAIEDAVWGYGAPVSALTINDNAVRLSVAPASVAGESATAVMEPALPYYTVDLNVTTAEAKDGSLVWVDRGMGSKVVRAYGRVALGGAADVSGLAIDDPAHYGAMAFKAMLQERGVEVTGLARASHREAEAMRPYLQVVREPYGQAAAGCVGCAGPLGAGEKLLASRLSPPLGEDVVVTNKVSQNLHAELMLHAMGLLRGDGSTAEGARAVRQFLLGAGVDGDDFVFFDGSGLSGHDLVTPRAVVRLLEYAAGQPWFPAWKASLPVGGVDGSLHGRFTQGPLVGKVFAKTGTLGEARALSGYVECASGRTVAFSVLVGGYVPGGRVVQGVIDSIVEAIAAND